MYRKLNRGDLEGSNPLLLLTEEERDDQRFVWWVYEDYDLVEAGDLTYIQAANQGNYRESPRPVYAYDPLTDTPRLFLDFARIVDHKNPAQELLDWFHKYGLLGLTTHHPRYPPIFPRDTTLPSWELEIIDKYVPKRRYDFRGGPGDSIEHIWALAEEANSSLVLYEAAIARDQEKLERALYPENWPEHAESYRRTPEVQTGSSDMERVDVLIHRAMGQIMEYLGGGLNFVYPDLASKTYFDGPPSTAAEALTPERLTRSWRPRNLWGAISLQFYWLVTSAGELARCKYCTAPISYAPSISDTGEERKPRSDKAFCNDSCRYSYHYHNRVKPTREGKSQR
jgi:hypothetical protein